MKPYRFFLMIVMLACGMLLSAQEPGNILTVQGVVRDAKNGKPLEYVNVSVVGSKKGTVTNKDGVFSIKMAKDKASAQLKISHLGYVSMRLAVTDAMRQGTWAMCNLKPSAIELGEVVITPVHAQQIVEAAMHKVQTNYAAYPSMLTGFYRETIQRRKKYISVTEAVNQIYKTPYTQDEKRERVRILKSRRLMSPKLSDTLSVKLQDGPVQPIVMDIVKTPWPLLEQENLMWYSFAFVDYATIDGRTHYKIHFEPIVEQLFPLFSGNYYIDKEDLSFSRVELDMDMRDYYKATQLILRKKPFGMRFKPLQLSFLITYRTIGERSYLNFVQSILRFQCDWKKRLFHTNYTIVSETAITDREDNPTQLIPYKEAFRLGTVFADKVADFQDADFWQEYNIIEPTESLEHAVDKLRKAY